jgi:phosphatidylglycerol:prolipoprotein diacylglycerol transferase
MLVHPQFDPIALDLSKIGVPIAVHWYGITYLVGFGLFLFLAARRARLPQFESRGWTRRDVEDLLFYGVLGTVIGGRLGYVLFYKPGYYAAHPVAILAVWKGGMAFHGGLLGVIGAIALFARSRKRPFLEVTDLVAPCVPTGFAAGRIGNFINGELWGKPTDVPWGVVVDGVPLHATQLYEASLEGVLLFIILWWYTGRPRPRMAPTGLFLIIYSLSRITVEFWRVPDHHLNYLLGTSWITMGIVLSLPMLLIGLALMFMAYRRREPSGNFVAAPQPA